MCAYTDISISIAINLKFLSYFITYSKQSLKRVNSFQESKGSIVYKLNNCGSTANRLELYHLQKLIFWQNKKK